MFAFFLKKNFCDGWDNLFLLAFTNIITALLVVGLYFGAKYADSVNPYLGGAFVVFSMAVFMSLAFAIGANSARIAGFGKASLPLFFQSLKIVWKKGFAFGLCLALALLVCRYAVIYYLSLYFSGGNLIGLAMAAFLLWMILFALVALQWFIPLYFLQENNGFKKCFKKSFIIFFDNAGFSFLVFIYNIVLFVLSCPFFTILPGVSGIVLSSMNALRLRLYKYDWIEKMSESDPSFESNRDKRNEVPWDELLFNDKEALGPRKLISFIMPWK